MIKINHFLQNFQLIINVKLMDTLSWRDSTSLALHVADQN